VILPSTGISYTISASASPDWGLALYSLSIITAIGLSFRSASNVTNSPVKGQGEPLGGSGSGIGVGSTVGSGMTSGSTFDTGSVLLPHPENITAIRHKIISVTWQLLFFI
jgi:hypothetical protein